MSAPSRTVAVPDAARRAVAIAIGLCLVSGCGGGPDAARSGAAFQVERSFDAEGASLRLSLEREALTTAESVLMRLEVECAEADEVGFPDVEDGIGGFAVVREDRIPDRLLPDGRVARGREYLLEPFLPGTYEVPSLEVTLNESARIATDPVEVQVTSVLDDAEDAELRDISEPVDVPAPWWWWPCVVLATVAALAAAVRWWRRRSTVLTTEPDVPAHEAALAAVDALVAEGLVARGEFKPFFLRLSDIVRRYVEERFGLRAPEQTTEEFLAAMAEAPEILRGHQRLLRGFLEQADLVKFAEFVPGDDEVAGSVEAARAFIRRTVPEPTLVGESGR